MDRASPADQFGVRNIRATYATNLYGRYREGVTGKCDQCNQHDFYQETNPGRHNPETPFRGVCSEKLGEQIFLPSIFLPKFKSARTFPSSCRQSR